MRVFRAESQHLDDISELFDQYRQFYRQAPDPGGCREFINARMENDESVIFAAVHDDGRIIGFTQLYHSFCSVDMVKLIYLYDLYVAPHERRQGAAQALMEAARQYGIEQGAGRLQLETATDNRPAQSLYEALGWKRDTEFYTYHLPLKAS